MCIVIVWGADFLLPQLVRLESSNLKINMCLKFNDYKYLTISYFLFNCQH